VLTALTWSTAPAGRVTGVDLRQANLAAASRYINDSGLKNVELVQADVLNTNLPRESFDFVHVRFMFTPLGFETGPLQEMLALARPGGVIAAQETCGATYECYPPQAEFERLKQISIAAFAQAGGD
jgi:ubiquinone/menaquinone biosynthesis C-methylase UbiE